VRLYGRKWPARTEVLDDTAGERARHAVRGQRAQRGVAGRARVYRLAIVQKHHIVQVAVVIATGVGEAAHDRHVPAVRVRVQQAQHLSRRRGRQVAQWVLQKQRFCAPSGGRVGT
jgi:hypothetical protein